MKIKFLLVLLFLTCLGLKEKDKWLLTHELIGAETDRIYDKLVEIRRHFHKNPELAGNELQTKEFIIQYLRNLGIEVDTSFYGHGIVGILKGKNTGKKIAWRADMDALASDFPDQAEFKSKVKGVQHGCGHDIHLAIALGIAEVLSKNKESINGTVYFIFQPEEETFFGAKGMVGNGLFSRISPKEIYGLHVTALPVGQIMVKSNEMFAYQKRIRIEMRNELSDNESKELTENIYNSLSRSVNDSKPWELQHIIDPIKGLSSPRTIFQDYMIIDKDFRIYPQNDRLILEASLYETNLANIKKILPKIEQLIKNGKYKEKLLSVSFLHGNPTVVNDEKLTKQAIKTLNKIYGNKLAVPSYGQVPYFNDDFGYFQQKVPGVYFFLGGSNLNKRILAMNHAPTFNVDDESIKIGVRSFSSFIFERLN